mgnify:CR=1 FL=1
MGIVRTANRSSSLTLQDLSDVIYVEHDYGIDIDDVNKIIVYDVNSEDEEFQISLPVLNPVNEGWRIQVINKGSNYISYLGNKIRLGGSITILWVANEYIIKEYVKTSNEEVRIHTFVNQSEISVQYYELFELEVFLLNGSVELDHYINLTLGGETDTFVSVGKYELDENNQWSVSGVRNAFKGMVSDKYLVFDNTMNSWILGILIDHTLLTSAGTEKTVLHHTGILPESYGSVTIDNRFEHLPTEYFDKCEPAITFDSEQEVASVSFGGTLQSGFIKL